MCGFDTGVIVRKLCLLYITFSGKFLFILFETVTAEAHHISKNTLKCYIISTLSQSSYEIHIFIFWIGIFGVY